MKIYTETYTLPAYWASYLINGDASGMEDAEVAEVDSWLTAHPKLGACLDVSEGEEFAWRNDANSLGGDVAEFTFPLNNPRPQPPRFFTAKGDRTAYALACGYSQSYGEHVTLEREHGVYQVKRNPAHPAGWKWESALTLEAARKVARRLARETAP